MVTIRTKCLGSKSSDIVANGLETYLPGPTTSLTIQNCFLNTTIFLFHFSFEQFSYILLYCLSNRVHTPSVVYIKIIVNIVICLI